MRPLAQLSSALILAALVLSGCASTGEPADEAAGESSDVVASAEVSNTTVETEAEERDNLPEPEQLEPRVYRGQFALELGSYGPNGAETDSFMYVKMLTIEFKRSEEESASVHISTPCSGQWGVLNLADGVPTIELTLPAQHSVGDELCMEDPEKFQKLEEQYVSALESVDSIELEVSATLGDKLVLTGPGTELVYRNIQRIAEGDVL